MAGSEDEAGEQSFGQPERLKRPSASQIAEAVDGTPTVEDKRSPEIPVPSYLEKHDDSQRLVGTVGADPKAAGFTDVPNADPTIKAASMSAPVVGDDPRRPAQGTPWLVPVLVAFGVAAVVIVLVMR